MKRRLPRGAGQLLVLVSSSLPEKDQNKYQREIKKIADNPTLNREVRSVATGIFDRCRQNTKGKTQ